MLSLLCRKSVESSVPPSDQVSIVSALPAAFLEIFGASLSSGDPPSMCWCDVTFPHHELPEPMVTRVEFWSRVQGPFRNDSSCLPFLQAQAHFPQVIVANGDEQTEFNSFNFSELIHGAACLNEANEVVYRHSLLLSPQGQCSRAALHKFLWLTLDSLLLVRDLAAAGRLSFKPVAY